MPKLNYRPYDYEGGRFILGRQVTEYCVHQEEPNAGFIDAELIGAPYFRWTVQKVWSVLTWTDIVVCGIFSSLTSHSDSGFLPS